MRPDPFKRVGAYCFCRSELFQPIDVFSRSWMMFPAGRIFSAVMSLLSAVRVFYLPYCIVPADRCIFSVVDDVSDGICVAEILFRSGRHCFGRAQRRLQEMAGDICIPYIRNEKRAAFAGWPFTIWNIVILRANAYFASGQPSQLLLSGHAAQSSVEQSPEQLI